MTADLPSAQPSAADIAAFLAGALGSPVTDLAPIGHGEWSRAYAFRCAGADYVARFSPIDDDFAKDRRAVAYATPALPIPRVVASGPAFGGYFAVSERAFGEYLDELDGPGLRQVLPAFFAALDAARLADLSATSGYGGWGADGQATFPTWQAALLDVVNDHPGGRVSGWRARLDADPARSGPFDAAATVLRSLVAACPNGRHLIHSDLLHYNVLVAGDRISAIFDWGCALYGDFLYDIAWCTFWAPWYPAWAGVNFADEAQRHFAAIGFAVPNFAARLRCYELHIGLDSLAYNAFRNNWEDFAWTAKRTLEAAYAAP